MLAPLELDTGSVVVREYRNGQPLCMCDCGEVVHNDTNGKPRRFLINHDKRKPNVIHVDPVTGCWNWGLSKTRAGYGQLRDYRLRKQVYAHRWYYEQYRGPIPHGHQIDHLCRNRGCVNPAHLEVVTGAENTRRGNATLLSREEVNTMRMRYTAFMRALADEYGVSRDYVREILHGRERGVLA